jgi:hypothetical protein
VKAAGRRGGSRRWLVFLGFAPLVCAAQSTPAPQDSLAACAALSSDAERLACYDRMAGHTAAPATKPAAPIVPGPAPAAAAVPVPAPPAAVPAVAPPPAPSAPPAPSVAASGGTAATPAAPAASQSFGLYEIEHPKVAVNDSVEARVTSLGKSRTGHMTVALEGGALWELDDGDPLLAPGDRVVITRAALGSYLMHTPTRRVHRVRRLQ